MRCFVSHASSIESGISGCSCWRNLNILGTAVIFVAKAFRADLRSLEANCGKQIRFAAEPSPEKRSQRAKPSRGAYLETKQNVVIQTIVKQNGMKQNVIPTKTRRNIRRGGLFRAPRSSQKGGSRRTKHHGKQGISLRKQTLGPRQSVLQLAWLLINLPRRDDQRKKTEDNRMRAIADTESSPALEKSDPANISTIMGPITRVASNTAGVSVSDQNLHSCSSALTDILSSNHPKSVLQQRQNVSLKASFLSKDAAVSLPQRYRIFGGNGPASESNSLATRRRERKQFEEFKMKFGSIDADVFREMARNKDKLKIIQLHYQELIDTEAIDWAAINWEQIIAEAFIREAIIREAIPSESVAINEEGIDFETTDWGAIDWERIDYMTVGEEAIIRELVRVQEPIIRKIVNRVADYFQLMHHAEFLETLADAWDDKRLPASFEPWIPCIGPLVELYRQVTSENAATALHRLSNNLLPAIPHPSRWIADPLDPESAAKVFLSVFDELPIAQIFKDVTGGNLRPVKALYFNLKNKRETPSLPRRIFMINENSDCSIERSPLAATSSRSRQSEYSIELIQWSLCRSGETRLYTVGPGPDLSGEGEFFVDIPDEVKQFRAVYRLHRDQPTVTPQLLANRSITGSSLQSETRKRSRNLATPPQSRKRARNDVTDRTYSAPTPRSGI